MSSKIKIYRGISYPMTYAHKDSAGAAVSLVGCTVYFTVKDVDFDTDATDASAKIKKTITSHDNAAAGLTSWQLTDADTYIAPGDYFFDVIVEPASGLAEPPSLIGAFIVLPQTTNRNVGNE